MHLERFVLKQFPKEEHRPDIRITGTVGRRLNTLSIGYAVEGDLPHIAIPPPERSHQRKDRLWDKTCFELFVGAKGSERYWEFHFSPSGHWNVYCFTSYRKGMREEAAFTSLPFHTRMEAGAFRLHLDLALGKILPGGQALEAAVGVVVRSRTGTASHWAMAHPGLRPDFHRRDGFRMVLPAE